MTQQAARPRWTTYLLAGTLLLVFAGLAAEIAWLARSRRGERAPEDRAGPREEYTPVARREDGPPSAEEEKGPATPALSEPMSGAGPRIDLEPVLGALGTLTGANLYQSYLNIGLLADSVEDDVYDIPEAKRMLARVTTTLEAVDRQLSRIPSAALDDDERRKLVRVRELHGLLREQGNELRAYWDTNRKEHAERFQEARKKAWAGLEGLLELED